jgi:hypothetical protein
MGQAKFRGCGVAKLAGCTVAKLLESSVAKMLGSDVALPSFWGLVSVLTGRNMFIDFYIGGTSKNCKTSNKSYLGLDVKKN